MFDILMYLFENYIHSEAEVMVDHDILTDELTRAGFHQDEIYKGSKSNNDYSKEQLINLKESASDINLINDSQSKSTHKDLKNI